ncbi:CDC45-like protein [Exidia glandulosa HHB12029]|uniref:CDC45-like protein n=1 Tax=Exidia glandulosa HHB12029 TaxID=1314781 RepID=A0A165EBQ9_EXIGL|nr:CDC45-like protein [Exidia glandulosa HHB12029]
MVYISPSSARTYADVYQSILNAYRCSPSTAASSIIILVAPDVDALCAARILQTLLKQDEILHRIIPVSGMEALERQRDELVKQPELHTLILLNMGSILDLPSPEWFGEFHERLTVHVVDSLRPQNLASLFDTGDEAERIVVWDDGKADNMKDEREAWEQLMAHPEDSDDEDNDSDDDLPREDDEDVLVQDSGDESETSSGKRRRSGGSPSPRGKRRRIDAADRQPRFSRELRDMYSERVEKHYGGGTWYGQAASGAMYALASQLERVDNDVLWLAILGLTYQYTTSRISRDEYDKHQGLFQDEVLRLNPAPPTDNNSQSLHADDTGIRPSEELRFTLYRHWALFESMYHSAYVANKLGTWKDRGRKRLQGLLAKMGFSILQTQQVFTHMDMSLKRKLRTKLDAIAPEYGLLELTYASFTRCHGYRTQALSAADMVEGLAALLDVAGGYRIEVDVDGTRNGGEWFGGGKVWSVREADKWKEDERENIPPGQTAPQGNKARAKSVTANGDDVVDDANKPLEWWIKNFWTAFDALGDMERVNDSLKLARALHQAIIRQGTSIIDKQDIRTMHGHRVVILQQGPDLALFTIPGVLARLALWLIEAMRDKVADGKQAKKRKSLPFVVACLDEKAERYLVVGVTSALEFGDIRRNQFGLAFLQAKAKCNARTRHGSFDTSIIEINQDDLNIFLQTLTNESGPKF